MADYSNVFRSEIVRSQKYNVNDLYELLNVSPAVPVHVKNKEEAIDFNFVPNTDKQFTPKKRSKLKVKSVRDLRRIFEKEVLSYLPGEIKNQEEYLLNKIKSGAAKKKHMKSIAKKFLMYDRPISKSVLQMLMNINPDEHKYSVQYALYKGKHIRINGSTGGKHPIRFDCDISAKKLFSKRSSKSTNLKKKKGLLHNSLAIKFKPGPLAMKKTLDVSYQKYNVGTTELVNLPKPVLCLEPIPGVSLEPSISKLVQSFTDDDGIITEKWAEFSVSVVRNSSNNIARNLKNNCVKFDLNYTCNQKKLLMRRDEDSACNITHDNDTLETSSTTENLQYEIKTVISKLLDAVEIHELQDELFMEDDEIVDKFHEDSMKIKELGILSKDKKKKRFGELGKLDVTVIQLPDEVPQEINQTCSNLFCVLGCVCPSLRNQYNIKQHCGRIKCMFQCQCDYSKYAVDSFGNSELIPGIINLDNEINCKLSKEEKKFHQTVVFTGNESIVLKSHKRTGKASKWYEDFYSDMSLKTDVKLQKEVSVELVKLNCENIESWCMVHHLYRCFCKGKFTHVTEKELYEDNVITDNPKNDTQPLKSSEFINNRNPTKYSEKLSNDMKAIEIDYESFCYRDRCARATTYKRKYRDSFYSEMQNKIMEMEKNDESLRKRLQQIVEASIIDPAEFESHTIPATERAAQYQGRRNRSEADTMPFLNKKIIEQNIDEQMKDNSKEFDNILQAPSNPDLLSRECTEIEQKELTRFIGLEEAKNPVQDKAKLVAWLETSYKQYKRRSIQGKIVLEPPKNKKLVIYPWDFILSRYKAKKNIFLVTKNKPFRLFMAVDPRNSFFKNCININGIELSDLHKYPVTVQRLLTCAPDSDDNFCILLGLSCCWEFVGSLSKVGEGSPSCSLVNEQNTSVCDISDDSEALHFEENDDRIVQATSKWFVLVVEADFGEIQFSEHGFFVRYQSIIKAVNVSRLSGKTVRLSSQKTLDNSSSPQFGVYAIPAIHEYCVFIGPYQDGDNLGIEIIKSAICHSGTTKGFWITTKKNENFKVIENPLSFLSVDRDTVKYVMISEISERLPENSAKRQGMNKSDILENRFGKSALPACTLKLDTLQKPQAVPLATTSDADISKNHVPNITRDSSLTKTHIPIVSKSSLVSEHNSKQTTIKPITISKANGFYKILPKVGFSKCTTNDAGSSHLNTRSIAVRSINSAKMGLNEPKVLFPVSATATSTAFNKQFESVPDKMKPIAEIAPQIKIVDVYSESPTQQSSHRNTNPGRGMFILKPEEINQKLVRATDNKISDQRIDEDIENFLATTVNVHIPPNSMLMESDEEDTAHVLNTKEIFIECKTVENLGWIKGKINNDNHISFKFPGFAYTNYYPAPEAFSKINQVLSRKVYVPRSIDLEWNIVEAQQDLKTDKILSPEQLGVDFVLTRRGLKHRGDIITYAAKSLLKPTKTCSSVSEEPTTVLSERVLEVEKASEALIDQECKSQEMEHETDQLLQELNTVIKPAIYRKNPITNEITPTQREQIAGRLQDLLASADDEGI